MLLLIERRNKMVKKKNVLEKKIMDCLDYEEFNEKPRKEEVIKISERIAGQAIYLSNDELMKTVTVPNARTFTPAVFNDDKRTNQSWNSQQVFALDIDSGLRIEEAIKLSTKL